MPSGKTWNSLLDKSEPAIVFLIRLCGWSAIIFVFGLFHGLGFASVMGDLPFRMMNLVKVILTFNVGVEIGQIAIVAALMPLLFLLRKHPAYELGVLRIGSIAICLVAGFWFVERALGLG